MIVVILEQNMSRFHDKPADSSSEAADDESSDAAPAAVEESTS